MLDYMRYRLYETMFGLAIVVTLFIVFFIGYSIAHLIKKIRKKWLEMNIQKDGIAILCSNEIQIMQLINNYTKQGYIIVKPPIDVTECVFSYRHDTKLIDYISKWGYERCFKYSHHLVKWEDM